MLTHHDHHDLPPRSARKGRRWLVAFGFIACAGLLSAAEPSAATVLPPAALPTVAPSKMEAVLHTLVQYKWAVLVLLLSLVGLIHVVRKLATESERRKLNILQRCLIGSILFHLLMGFFVTTWIVSNAVKRSVIEVTTQSGLVPIDLASLTGESESGGEADPRLVQALREQVSNLPNAGSGMAVARATGQTGGGGAPIRNGNVMTGGAAGGATGRSGPSASFTVSESSSTESAQLKTASASTLAPQSAQMSGSLEARADTSVPRPEMARAPLDLAAPSQMAVQQVTPEMARPTMNVRVQRAGTTASRMVQVATAESSGATGESTSAAPSLSPASAAAAMASMSANTSAATTGVQMESARPVAASAAGPTMQNPSSRMDASRGATDPSGGTSARAEMSSANAAARTSPASGATGSAVGSFGPVSSGSAASQAENLGAASAAGAMAAMAGGNLSGTTTSAMQMEAGQLGGGASGSTGAKSSAGMAGASSRMDVSRAANGSANGNQSSSSGRAAMGSGALAGGQSGAGQSGGSSAVGSFGPASNGSSGGGEGLSAASAAGSLSSSAGNGAAGGSAAGGMQMEAGRLGGASGSTGAKSGSGLAGASSRMDVSPAGNGSSGSGSSAPGRAGMGSGTIAGGKSGAGRGAGSSAVGSFGPSSGGGSGSGDSLASAGSSGGVSGLPQFAMAGGGGFRAEMASPGAGGAGKSSEVGRASSKVGVSRAGDSGIGEGGAGGGPARPSGSGGSSGGVSKLGSFAASQKVDFGSGTGDGVRGLGSVSIGGPGVSPKFGGPELKLETKPASVASAPKPATPPEARPSAPIMTTKATMAATKVERPVALIAKAPMDMAPLRPVFQSSAKLESIEVSRPSELPVTAATRLTDIAVPLRPAVASLIDTKNPLALRSPELRAGLIDQLGGNDETEAAVRRALDWFKRTQEREGHWARGGQGHQAAGTALAMLCFMGYGAKHTEPGPYQETLERAMTWLLKRVKAEGDLRDDGDMYDQAIVAMALAEAFNLTKDPRLQEPVRKAVSFIVAAQNKQTGGWRYKPWSRDPQEKGDLSVTGWQIMALKSASLAGVAVPPDTFASAGRFIESLGRGRQGGLYGYRAADSEPKSAMTAQALFSRLLLGQGTGDPRTAETLVYLRERLPNLNEVNYYYWYYGCLALYQHQGAVWEEWNARMRPIFLKGQRRDGHFSGSWDAEGDRKESYGRVVTTALATLSLEVYYRYLPLYKPTLTAATEAQK